MSTTRRYRLVIAYLGGNYRGWQRQRNAPSVQGAVEAALSEVFGGLAVTVEGSGRTDAGVHATGQIAHIDLPATIPPANLLKALNHSLPDDVRIRSAAVVPQTFHSRKSSRGKRYAYRIRWDGAPTLPPWQTLRTAHIRPPRNPEHLADLLSLYRGRHDWAAFTVAHPITLTTTRTVFNTKAVVRPWGLRLEFIGNGFVRYQIRRMVGALLQIGWEHYDHDWLEELLASARHSPDVYTAPARGLTLEHVYFRSPGETPKS